MRIVSLTVVLAILTVGLNAAAFQPETECPKLPDDPVKAQILAGELFTKAEQKYLTSKPIEALKGFLCSHHVIQHENTLFNIAQIAKVSKLKDAALEMLKDYVENVKRSTKTDPIRDIIAELKSDDGDVETAQPTPETTAPSRPAADTPVETEPKPSSDDTAGTNGARIASWILMGTGGGCLIAGAVMQGVSGGAQTRAEETNQYSVFQKERDKMHLAQRVAIAGFASGGVLLGVGLALFVVSGTRERESKTRLSTLNVFMSPDGLFIQGRF
jgi:hypothetical protein